MSVLLYQENVIFNRISRGSILDYLFDNSDTPRNIFLAAVVTDTNANCIADPDEIAAESTDIVGVCIYPNGRNTWQTKDERKLTWASIDFTGRGNPTGKICAFTYTPDRRYLQIRKRGSVGEGMHAKKLKAALNFE